MPTIPVQAKENALSKLLWQAEEAGGEFLFKPEENRVALSRGMGYIFWVPRMEDAKKIVAGAQDELDRAYKPLIFHLPGSSVGDPDPEKKARMDAKAVEGSDFTLGRYAAWCVYKDSRDGLVSQLAFDLRMMLLRISFYLEDIKGCAPSLFVQECRRASETAEQVRSDFDKAVEYIDSHPADTIWHCRYVSGEARRLSYYALPERKRKRVNVGDLTIVVSEEKPVIHSPKLRAESPLQVHYEMFYLGTEFEPLA